LLYVRQAMAAMSGECSRKYQQKWVFRRKRVQQQHIIYNDVFFRTPWGQGIATFWKFAICTPKKSVEIIVGYVKQKSIKLMLCVAKIFIDFFTQNNPRCLQLVPKRPPRKRNSSTHGSCSSVKRSTVDSSTSALWVPPGGGSIGQRRGDEGVSLQQF